MPDPSFVLMFDEVRGMTLRILEGVDEKTARWRPPGLANSILWHAGHNYVVLEWIAMQSLSREPLVPNDWEKLFSWDSHPATIPDEQFPSLAEVIQELKSQHQRLCPLLANLTEKELEHPSAAWPEKTVRQMILHAYQDEASHKGEIWLLRKLQGIKKLGT